jgi:leucyl-tRNA synthetase
MMTDTLEIIVQVNGKLRSKITVDGSIENTELEQLVLMDEKIKKYTDNQTIKKIIIVPKKLVNIVI